MVFGCGVPGRSCDRTELCSSCSASVWPSYRATASKLRSALSGGNLSRSFPVPWWVSELCFGLFVALTFVGAVSAATAGEDAGQKMMYAALGCNLAWALADAAMFLVCTLANRGRRLTLALTVKNEPDAATGVRALRDTLSKSMKALVADAELELIRARLAAKTTLPAVLAWCSMTTSARWESF
jgi:hypothetical protein